MNAMGFRPGFNYAGCGDWKSNGRTIARYDNWSTTRTRPWMIDLPEYVNGNGSDGCSASEFVKPLAFAVEGDYVVASWAVDSLVPEG